MEEYSNVSMASFTTWGIGAIAKKLIVLEDYDDLCSIFDKYPNPLIIGNGSNLLVAHDVDVVVKLGRSFPSAQHVHAICKRFAYQKRSGLEFLMGIPASLGGAVKMNAGGKYGQISDVVESVTIFDREIKTITPTFAYRSSNINGIILDATFKTATERTDNILARMKEIIDEKKISQPLNENTAGCTFRNPEGEVAARLIDKCGLKGYKVGGAEVSRKHANFIVANSGTNPQQILDLISKVRDIVFDRTGYRLELEIQIW